jgi:hypothetical protein
MAVWDNLSTTLFGGGIMVAVTVVVGVIIILLLVLGGWLLFIKKRWNLKVEFKMVRSDGRVTIPEWGKGRYDANNGVIYLKRKRKKAEAVKAKRLDKYLQGSNTITAVGNPGNWRLVIPDTFLELEDDETGETAAVINLRADTKEDKSWAVSFERMAGRTFTIQNFLQQYGHAIEVAFIILITVIANFIGFSIVLNRLGK